MIRFALSLLCLFLAAANLLASGSGLNVVVVVNTNSADSLQLGNYYCEKRGVPPQNVLRIGWAGDLRSWSRTNLDLVLRRPLEAMLSNRALTNQVEFVLLSMHIPYRVTETTGNTESSGVNSTTSALFYGFKPDGCETCPFGIPGCELAPGSTNDYAGSERSFRETQLSSGASNAWLVMMLTSSNLTQVKTVVDRAVAADYSFPTQTVYLIHYEPDPFRGVRHYQYDDAIFENQVRGAARVDRFEAAAPGITPNTFGYQLGSQFGLMQFNLAPGLFAPGALADNLTSYGGLLFDSGKHTGPIEYLNAGAVASYGTVVEPCAYLEKFPSPRNYFYQARGFSAAECYYLSVTNPYQGILVGEPLCAPFARPAAGGWLDLPEQSVLSGTTNLTLSFTGPDATRLVGRVDWFVDGNFARTLTNLTPRSGNQVAISLNGQVTNYTIPVNATLESVAAALTARLNQTDYRNATGVEAIAHGDRIELRSLDVGKRGEELTVNVAGLPGTADLLTTGIHASRSNFLDSPATGYTNFMVTNAVGSGDFLELAVTKTNGQTVSVSVTNPPGNTNTSILISNLVTAINSHPALTGPDGVIAVDFFSYNQHFQFQGAEFNLRTRAPGWLEAQVLATLAASSNLAVAPTGPRRLDANVADLQPRNHVYITCGLTNLTIDFNLDTTVLADGFHELTVVAYEGSHVGTPKRATRRVKVQNSTLQAVLDCQGCDTNTAVEATLQFQVTANTSGIASIELFSTGGCWGAVSNQATAQFILAASHLGVGLHPFYAVVTRDDGKRYRTETKWIRLIGDEPPLKLSVAGVAPELSWPATAGRRYEILTATNLAQDFVLRDSVIPTNSAGRWMETNPNLPQRFYRLRAVP